MVVLTRRSRQLLLPLLLPVASSLLGVLSVTVPYVVAVRLGHLQPLLHALCLYGCCPPESYLFKTLVCLYGASVAANRLAVDRTVSASTGGWRAPLRPLGLLAALVLAVSLCGMALFSTLDYPALHRAFSWIVGPASLVTCGAWAAQQPATTPAAVRRLRYVLLCLCVADLAVVCVAWMMVPAELTRAEDTMLSSCNASAIPVHLWGPHSPAWRVNMVYATSEWLVYFALAVFNLLHVFDIYGSFKPRLIVWFGFTHPAKGCPTRSRLQSVAEKVEKTVFGSSSNGITRLRRPIFHLGQS